MGSGRRVRATVILPNEKQDRKQESPQAERSRKRAAEVLDQIPMQTTVDLSRMDPATGAKAYLCKLDADLFSLEYVKQQYGGGDYVIEIRGPTGHGRVKGYQGGDKFTIDKMIPPKYPVGAAPAAPAAGTPNAMENLPQLMMMGLMKQMLEMGDLQAQAFRKALEGVNGGKRDVDPILTALASKLAADPFDQVIRLRELESGSKRGSVFGEMTQALEMMDRLQEMRGGGNGHTEDPGWMRLVELIAPAWREAVRADGRAIPAEVSPAPATAVATPAPSPAPRAAAAGPGVPSELVALRPVITDIIRAAENGTDPRLAADWIAQTTATGVQELLRRALADPAMLAHLANAYPALTSYTEWLVEVRRELLDALAPDGGMGGGEGGSNGDADEGK